MLQFKHNGVLVSGYAPFTHPHDYRRPGVQLALVWFEGIPEEWLVEGSDGLAALRKHYTDEWGDREIPIQVYNPVVS